MDYLETEDSLNEAPQNLNEFNEMIKKQQEDSYDEVDFI